VGHRGVTRYDYRQSAFERLLGRRPRIALDRRLWPSFAAVAAAVLLVAMVTGAETRRIAILDGDLATFADRIARADRDAARDRRAIAAVEHDRLIADALLGARRDTAVATNAIARIGNRLPARTWLTSVRTDPGGAWSIAGRSTQIERIGATLAAIAALDRGATTALVSIAASGRTGHTLDFTIAWEPAR